MNVRRTSDAETSNTWAIRGQDRIVNEFRRAIDRGPGHAYILSGPHESGKNALAKAFAQALNCQESLAPGVPFGACSRCRRIGRNVFPDVSRFSLATQVMSDTSTSRNLTLNVSTVREISGTLALRPAESRWRVIIVDDVETMQETAQEAFLKTLEEPPTYAIILLLTSDADQLLPTILSRCTILRLARVTPSTIANALVETGVNHAAAEEIAAIRDGRLGWAFRAAHDSRVLKERAEQLASVRAWIAGDSYERLVTASLLADQFLKDRDVVFESVQLVQQVWRNHMLEASSPADLRGIVDSLRSVERCLSDLEANVRPRAAIQAMVVNWSPAPDKGVAR